MVRARTFEVKEIKAGSKKFFSLPKIMQDKIYNIKTMLFPRRAIMAKLLDVDSNIGNGWYVPVSDKKVYRESDRILMIKKAT